MKILLVIMLFCGLLNTDCHAASRNRASVAPVRNMTEACIMEAARISGMPLAALFGILATEGGRTGEALDNTNGTWDLGGFQINTAHIDELLALGIRPEAVLADGCVNAHAAALILKKEYQRTGDIWLAIGAYHSRTPWRRDAYIRRVQGNLKKLSRQGIAMLEPFYSGTWQ